MSIASDFFKLLKKHPERFYVIHYSSQSLYDGGADGGLSPRITSIVAMHYTTQQTEAFATHAIAQELGISKENVEIRFDEIEREILERFFNFAKDLREKVWIHWNMRNLVFGFEHLEHRYRVLTKKAPPSIPIESRVNLNDVLADRYGREYAPHPRMLKLMLLNGERDTRFLEGKEEAAAFSARDFIRMNSSTISKVEFFRFAANRAQSGKLKTVSNGVLVWVDRLLESRWARLAALVTTIASLMTLVATRGREIFDWITKLLH